MVNPFEFFELAWKLRGDPLAPPEGEAAQEASPLDSHERLNFSLYAAEVRSIAMLHGANPDEAMSARGPSLSDTGPSSAF
jgi:hypothetical protein